MKTTHKLIISLCSFASIVSFSNLNANEMKIEKVNSYYTDSDYNYYEPESNSYNSHPGRDEDKFYNYSHPYGSQGSRGGYSNYWDQNWNEAHDSDRYNGYSR